MSLPWASEAPRIGTPAELPALAFIVALMVMSVEGVTPRGVVAGPVVPHEPGPAARRRRPPSHVLPRIAVPGRWAEKLRHAPVSGTRI